MKEIKYLNDKVIKKALAKENKEIRNYVARIISDTTNIPYELLEDNLELVYPEVSYNSTIINSEADLVFKNDAIYFNIEINYGRSKTLKVKNLSYVFQLSLRQLKNYKEYENMNKVIQININSYDPYGYGEFLYETGLMVKKYNIEYSNQISIYEINLAYYKNIDYNKIEKEKLLKDLALLVIEDVEVLDKLYKGDRIMDNVQRKMKGLVEEVDGILYYDEKKLQEAIEKEMTEKGLEQGEKKKALEVAKKLLPKMPLEEIAAITELPIEEVEKLKQNKSM